KEVTGYERGTITPFGASTAWPVIADAHLTGDPERRISLGAGAHGVAATVPAEQALAHLEARIADVTALQGICRRGSGRRARTRDDEARCLQLGPPTARAARRGGSVTRRRRSSSARPAAPPPGCTGRLPGCRAR